MERRVSSTARRYTNKCQRKPNWIYHPNPSSKEAGLADNHEIAQTSKHRKTDQERERERERWCPHLKPFVLGGILIKISIWGQHKNMHTSSFKRVELIWIRATLSVWHLPAGIVSSERIHNIRDTFNVMVPFSDHPRLCTSIWRN